MSIRHVYKDTYLRSIYAPFVKERVHAYNDITFSGIGFQRID
ncbi:10168_t:CDS:2 [Funneliformis caledonium]|uniref:10168_t:CDS:1 n=1 Tax=Funneliformis caledonium TaxID=1117310 RepID=A0A9N9FNL2_9GLOM|nr:10168_t:CDS:2 [Funneliformis caledonium]